MSAFDGDGVVAGQTPRAAVESESYHEMVQRHIRLWWHDAQRYERTSHLSRRVKVCLRCVGALRRRIRADATPRCCRLLTHSLLLSSSPFPFPSIFLILILDSGMG